MPPEEVPLRSCHIGTVKSHVSLVPQLFVFELIWFPENGSLRFSSDITNSEENRAKGISLRPPDRVMNICNLCCNRSPCERDPLLADEDLGKKVPCMAWLASTPPSLLLAHAQLHSILKYLKSNTEWPDQFWHPLSLTCSTTPFNNFKAPIWSIYQLTSKT